MRDNAWDLKKQKILTNDKFVSALTHHVCTSLELSKISTAGYAKLDYTNTHLRGRLEIVSLMSTWNCNEEQ